MIEYNSKKEKREKYNTNNIFKNKKAENIENSSETFAMIEYKETVINRIINKVKKLFRK